MRLPLLLLIVISLNFTVGSYLQAQSPQGDKDIFVTSEWLELNLKDTLLVLLHWGMKTDFDEEHIPGARFASTWDILVEDDKDRRNELPDENQLQSILRSWGINNNSKIVICYQDGNAIPRAARLFFTLDYAGLGNQVSILNGGLKAWKLEERVLTNELLPFKEGRVDIRIKEEVRITKEEVLANLDQDSVVIIDARPPEKYYGNEEDENLERFGHIPGAINIPFYEVIIENLSYKIKNTEELHLLFADYNIEEGNTIITYCGTGIWASSIYFTARALGYKVYLYDGSFQEWGNDSSYPVIGFE